jgi:hypothetical protein
MKPADAVAKYIELRDHKAALEKAHKEKVAQVNESLAKIESAFLKQFSEKGQQSAKFEAGTVFIKQRTSDKVFDREAFLDYVKKNDAFDFIENRVNKSALDQFVEDNDDLPPGVSRTSEAVINIRRS